MVKYLIKHLIKVCVVIFVRVVVCVVILGGAQDATLEDTQPFPDSLEDTPASGGASARFTPTPQPSTLHPKPNTINPTPLTPNPEP